MCVYNLNNGTNTLGGFSLSLTLFFVCFPINSATQRKENIKPKKKKNPQKVNIKDNSHFGNMNRKSKYSVQSYVAISFHPSNLHRNTSFKVSSVEPSWFFRCRRIKTLEREVGGRKRSRRDRMTVLQSQRRSVVSEEDGSRIRLMRLRWDSTF